MATKRRRDLSADNGDLADALLRRMSAAVRAQAGAADRLLRDILQYPSVQGKESEIQHYLYKAFRSLGYEIRSCAVPERIRNDKEYTYTDNKISYRGRPNLVVMMRGDGGSGGRSVILNTHSDVVSAEGWSSAFKPQRRGDLIIGRGACDAKGQIAAIYLTLSALKSSRVRLKGDIIIQIVIEEEVGGNGSLALIRDGIRADGVIVMEPTGLDVHPANRGVLWFRCLINGRSVHMGWKQEGVSAIDEMFKVINELKLYERYLLRKAKGHPMFRMHKCAAQINVGTMQAGDWPATVPGQAVIEGGAGFTPNVRMAEVKRTFRAIVSRKSGPWVRNHHRLEFPKLHNDAYEISSAHPLVLALQKAGRAIGHNPRVCGMTASCDARLFRHVGKMPVVVFGAGHLRDAHSDREQIRWSEIVHCAEMLGGGLIQWCGLAQDANQSKENIK